MAGLRRTDIVKLNSPVESGLIRFNPSRPGMRHRNPARSGSIYSGSVQSGFSNLGRPGSISPGSVQSGFNNLGRPGSLSPGSVQSGFNNLGWPGSISPESVQSGFNNLGRPGSLSPGSVQSGFNNLGRAGSISPGLVQSGYNNLGQAGSDLTTLNVSTTSGLDRSKSDQLVPGHSDPLQSGTGLRSRSDLRSGGFRSSVASAVKRPTKRSSANDSVTSEGASIPAKRRRTTLHHGARKLVTSIFGWKGPETEVGTDTGSHDCHRIRTADPVPVSTRGSCYHNDEIRHLTPNTDVSELTKQLDILHFNENKLSQSANHLSNGRKQFNMDPKKGVDYLIEHRVIENSPLDVATFMYTAQGLSKTAIGEYLGERHSFNQEALKAFVNLQEFSQTNLVQALRQFLWSFRLPGEAQKIDRMMEQFADRYCQLNPGVFNSTDACYILCFGLIMLNTSLHNPNVKDKLTSDAFVAMNRGLQADEEMPRQILLDLYGSIKREPLKIPEDEKEDLMFTFFNPVKEGWLHKRGGRCKTWKRRWFILNDGCLYYFQFTTDKEPKGIVPLENIEVREVSDRTKSHCLELYSPSTDQLKACKTDSLGRVVEGNHKVFRISASTPEEQESWIRSIRSAISDNPLNDLLNKRRRRSRLPVSD